VALRIEVQHAWLQRSLLASRPVPNGGELRTSPWLVPGLVADDERVQLGDTEVGKGVDDVIVVREDRASGEVDTTAGGKTLWIMGPDNRALLHIGEGATCHPLYGDGLDLHPLERADEREVDVGVVVRESQAVRLEGLQVFKLRQNVDLGAHLANIHLEVDEAAEDRPELELTEVVDGVRRGEFHVGELLMRAIPHNIDELVENDAILASGRDFERLEVVHRPAEYKGGVFNRRMGVDVELIREVGHGKGPPSLGFLRCQREAGIPSKLARVDHLEHVHTRVDLDIQWTDACPLQNEVNFISFGPRAEANV